MDRREEFKNKFWQQGRTYPSEQRLRGREPNWRLDSSDRRNAYVLVVKRQGKLINPMPDNIMVYRYATEAECAAAVFEHNKQVRDNAAKKT